MTMVSQGTPQAQSINQSIRVLPRPYISLPQPHGARMARPSSLPARCRTPFPVGIGCWHPEGPVCVVLHARDAAKCLTEGDASTAVVLVTYMPLASSRTGEAGARQGVTEAAMLGAAAAAVCPP
jgi:hypothetical protein